RAAPTRRGVRGGRGGRDRGRVGELAGPLPMSLPAVMKHLPVLAQAGLIARAKTGRTVACRLRAEPMEDARRWLDRYQRFWTEQLDRLAAFLEDEPCQSTSSRALPSSAATTPRRRKASTPGRP